LSSHVGLDLLSATLIPIHIVVQAVAPIFVLSIGGLVMRRYSILTAEADSSLLKLSINVLSPCLAFDSIVGNKALHNPSNLLIAPIIGYSTVAIGVMLALFTFRLLKLQDNKVKGTFALAVAIYNYGYVPLPLALYLFNRETAGVLFIHNLGVDMALWTIGVAFWLIIDRSLAFAIFVNMPLVSIVISVLLNFYWRRKMDSEILSISIICLGIVLYR
jgi:predicted permease